MIKRSLFFVITFFATLNVQGHDEWEEFVEGRYAKKKEEYRTYDENTSQHVKDFYRANHMQQTLKFVLQQKKKYLPPRKLQMSIWEAFECLESIVDQSDPDLGLPQIYHAYQTAEALRREGHPRWLILTGFIHDLGKILEVYGEPQWAIVGDTFPVGCPFSKHIVFHQYFAENPDFDTYTSPCGIYSPHCGLDRVHMSWGHDEYLYHVIKDYLPPEASYIIRYHSFYPLHREGAYRFLMNEKDHQMLPWLQLFSQYDLYSKESATLDMDMLRPYYEELIAEFFPENISW